MVSIRFDILQLQGSHFEVLFVFCFFNVDLFIHQLQTSEVSTE